MEQYGKSDVFENYEIIEVISVRSKVYLVKLNIHNLSDQKFKFYLNYLKKKFPETMILKEFDRSDQFKNELAIMLELKKLKKTITNGQIHFLKLYHDYIHQNKFQLFIQYCEKGSLADQIRKKLKDEEDQMLKNIIQMIQSLNLIHSSGIFHRDLKPDNIFITKKGIPLIGDFGLAITKPSLDPVGTLNYMSPDLTSRHTLAVKSNKYNPEPINWKREDLFSLGKTFYEYSVLKLYENFEKYNYEDIKIKVSRDLERFGYKNKFIRSIILMMSDENEECIDGADIAKIFINIKDNYDSLVLDDDVKLKVCVENIKERENDSNEILFVNMEIKGVRCRFTSENLNKVDILSQENKRIENFQEDDVEHKECADDLNKGESGNNEILFVSHEIKEIKCSVTNKDLNKSDILSKEIKKSENFQNADAKHKECADDLNKGESVSNEILFVSHEIKGIKCSITNKDLNLNENSCRESKQSQSFKEIKADEDKVGSYILQPKNPIPSNDPNENKLEKSSGTSKTPDEEINDITKKEENHSGIKITPDSDKDIISLGSRVSKEHNSSLKNKLKKKNCTRKICFICGEKNSDFKSNCYHYYHKDCLAQKIKNDAFCRKCFKPLKSEEIENLNRHLKKNTQKY